MTYAPRQIPDSAWARFRGLGKLRQRPEAVAMIASVAIAQRMRFEWITFVNAWLLRFL